MCTMLYLGLLLVITSVVLFVVACSLGGPYSEHGQSPLPSNTAAHLTVKLPQHCCAFYHQTHTTLLLIVKPQIVSIAFIT